MKIIDYYVCGNVVKFYLGRDNLDTWWGDDWDDVPYEHNAGRVYSEYIYDTVQLALSLDYVILEPSSDWAYNGNSPYCKEDMLKRNCPCLIITKNDYNAQYSTLISDRNSIQVYFGDSFDDLISALKGIQFAIFWRKENEHGRKTEVN